MGKNYKNNLYDQVMTWSPDNQYQATIFSILYQKPTQIDLKKYLFFFVHILITLYI